MLICVSRWTDTSQVKIYFYIISILFIIFNCDNFYLSKTQMRLRRSINTPSEGGLEIRFNLFYISLGARVARQRHERSYVRERK